ncbi:hybrid sensor histidine kinase/response regulator [Viridibacterium curvum]
MAWRVLRLPASLVGRVYLLYAATWLAFVASGLGLFYETRFHQNVEEQQQSAAMLIEVVAQSVGDSAVIGDYDTIQRMLEKSILSSSFSAATYIDLSGGKLVAQSARAVETPAPSWLVEEVAGELDEINRTITVGGKDYGVLRLQFDVPLIAGQLWMVVRLAAVLSVASLLGSLLLIWYPLRLWLGRLKPVSMASSSGPAPATAPVNDSMIANAPLEFRDTLVTLQATAERLQSELSHREQALSALRGIVADLMPAGDGGADTQELESVIQTISRLVAEREQAARQMREARDAADAANRAKSDFLANMSHEIRTPMNGVIGMLELALDTPLSGQQNDYLSTARSSADSLLAIINEILDFSKIEAGKISVEEIPVDLPGLLVDTLKPPRVTAEKKGLALELVTESGTPAFVLGDPVRLRQILNNLVSNAIKFTAEGRVTVSSRVVGEGGGARLQLAVQDTGIGIPLDKQQRIFDAFSQEDDSTTRRFGGTGLGLTICRKLANLMGGDILLDSQPGKGSCFVLDVPLRIAERPVERAAGSVTTATGGAGDAGLDVLVAEDNPTNQKLILALLKGLGHRTQLAQNGEEAVQQWSSGSFDIILMDMHMPVMGGIAATREIRKREAELARAPIQIFALTAAAMADEQQEGLEAGLDGYLTKPISRAALADTLTQVAAGLAAH